MATVSIREWVYNGETKHAFVVRFTDLAGARRMKHFGTQEAAQKYREKVERERIKSEFNQIRVREKVVSGKPDRVPEPGEIGPMGAPVTDTVLEGAPDPVPLRKALAKRHPASVPQPKPKPVASELLYGAKAIAAFLGIKQQAAYNLIRHQGLPAFKLGKTVCARPAAVTAWLDQQEEAANGQRP